MMELKDWINKSLNDISGFNLFKKYFSGIEIGQIEDVFTLVNLSEGIDVIFSDKMEVTSIHLFSEDYQGAKVFKGEGYSNVLSKSRRQINEFLGKPNSNGGGFDSPIFGYIELWDKYFYSNYSLHLRYSKDEQHILLITLGSLNLENSCDPD